MPDKRSELPAHKKNSPTDHRTDPDIPWVLRYGLAGKAVKGIRKRKAKQEKAIEDLTK